MSTANNRLAYQMTGVKKVPRTKKARAKLRQYEDRYGAFKAKWRRGSKGVV